MQCYSVIVCYLASFGTCQRAQLLFVTSHGGCPVTRHTSIYKQPFTPHSILKRPLVLDMMQATSCVRC